MIDLDKKSLVIVKKILQQYFSNTQVKVFGYRATGRAQKFSDLDLVVISDAPISIEKINEVKFAFSNSNLPILVDIVDWHQLSPAFRQKISASSVDL